ncbi:MAG: NAD(P)-dependent oxidoreductase [Candidatus Heimdallarchaeota archaeon]|nr:NAD(P)-dependent oxidoreductase [Candidatus Heimdallarchaeota archaeon]
MKVLITGAFGNLGLSALHYLLKTDHLITCLDLHTKRNKKQSRRFLKIKNFNIVWGDIRDVHFVVDAVNDQDCIIHLSGLTPPITEINPELAYSVNVTGTENILKGIEKSSSDTRLIFASSFSTYGPQLPGAKPKTVKDTLVETDVYTSNKIEIEKLIRNSKISWIIFRIAASPSLSLRNNQMDLLYDIPLDQQIDFIHPHDVGYALCKAVDLQMSNKIMNLGGGEKCHLINREFLCRYFEALGIGMLPDAAFRQPLEEKDWYYSSWLDSEEAQKLLKYQNHSFDDYLTEIKRNTGILAKFLRPLSPLIRKFLAKKSPYYTMHQSKDRIENWEKN